MGQAKALLYFAGQPLAARAVSILRQAGLPTWVVGERAAIGGFAPVVEDLKAGLGPLGGICSALASTAARHAVFLPVDMPLVPASLVRILLDHARITGRAVTLASTGGFRQSFPAVLERAVLPKLQAELDAGRGGCFAAFEAAAASLGQSVGVLPVELLAQSGHAADPDGLPVARWFLDVNTPAQLRGAEGQRTTPFK
jgi:molybdopterin-guanine dinucleotide biosynthesis protein A